VRDLALTLKRRIRRSAACLVLPYLPKYPGCTWRTPKVEQCMVGAMVRQMRVSLAADRLCQRACQRPV